MYRIVFAGVILAASSGFVGAEETVEVSAPTAHTFRLPTIDGSSVELTETTAADLTVVCFLGTECPLARL